MDAKVAVVKIKEDSMQALQEALNLLGGIAELNTTGRKVTIKLGIFDPRLQHHTSFQVVQAICRVFDQAPCIYLAESDNYCSDSMARLERFKDLFSARIMPFSLSNDPEFKTHTIAGEEMELSHVLLKPNVFTSTHILRTFSKGSVLKNLFGCTPMIKKGKYHKNELFHNLLADIYKTCGGIDLAVMDGTFLYHATSEKKILLNLLIVGKDAVAVETVGAILAGLKPAKNQTIQEFVRRGLGEGDINNIEIVGISANEFTYLKQAHKDLKSLIAAEPKRPGVSDTIDQLTEEGWLDRGRNVLEGVVVLQARGVSNATKPLVETTLKRRLGKTLERTKEDGVWIYSRKMD
jgi:uncharacterized protein (DUF362 family)